MAKHYKNSFAFYLIQAQLQIYIMTIILWSCKVFCLYNPFYLPNDNTQHSAVTDRTSETFTFSSKKCAHILNYNFCFALVALLASAKLSLGLFSSDILLCSYSSPYTVTWCTPSCTQEFRTSYILCGSQDACP